MTVEEVGVSEAAVVVGAVEEICAVVDLVRVDIIDLVVAGGEGAWVG